MMHSLVIRVAIARVVRALKSIPSNLVRLSDWYCRLSQRISFAIDAVHDRIVLVFTPCVRFQLVGLSERRKAFDEFPQGDLGSAMRPANTLLLRLRVSGLLLEELLPPPLRAPMVISVVVLFLGGLFYLLGMQVVGTQTKILLELSIAGCVYLLMFRLVSFSQSETFLKAAFELSTFALASGFIAYTAHGARPSSFIVGILGAVILRLLVLVICWERDLTRIYIVLLEPGQRLPNLPLNFSSGREDVVLALRLMSPNQRSQYEYLSLRRDSVWVSAGGVNYSSHLKARPYVCELNATSRDDLWSFCRYAVRRFMDGPHFARAYDGHGKEQSEGDESPSAWWRDIFNTRFTVWLHLSQIKAYLLLVVAILFSAWIYSFNHPTRLESESYGPPSHEIQNVAAPLKRLELPATDMKQLPVAFAGLAFVWALWAMFYRRIQINRLVTWERQHRKVNDNARLRAFEFLPDAPRDKGWLELRQDDMVAPIEKFGLAHGHVFHVLDAAMFVALLELLHILHL